jgi:acylphosphatase
MAKRLILHGRVQGVCCRAYCSQYARKLGIPGSASNRSDGTVRVILDTDDMDLVNRFIEYIRLNPYGFSFYGRIESIDVSDFTGIISGDYRF